MKFLRSLRLHAGCPLQIQRSRGTISKRSNVHLENNYVYLSTLREWVEREGREEGLDEPHGITTLVGRNGNHIINHPSGSFKSRKMSPPAFHSQHGRSTETEAVKNKIEFLMRRNTHGTINDTVFKILSVINENPKNKNVYINKNILIAFHTLLIKKKYHLSISKGSICNDLQPSIFHYIHHNVNLHLKHYHLSNVSELLRGLSKYMHKVNPSQSTKELVQNIFYFHFISQFNYFYYFRRRGNPESFGGDHERGAFFRKSSGRIYESPDLPGGHKNSDEFCKKDIHNEAYCEIAEGRNLSGKTVLQLGSPRNEKIREYPLKGSNRSGDPNGRDEVIFNHLNSYVVFLSNHPMYASEKVLHIISLLANKVTQANVSAKLALSFLSSSVNIFDKQKGNGRKLLLQRKVNYDILYAVIREWNEQVGEKPSGEEHKRDPSPSAQMKEGKKNASPLFVRNLWAYSHIINVLKILKVKNFLSSKFSFSEDAERCLVQLFNSATSLLGSFTPGTPSPYTMRKEECNSHWSTVPTQNELNSIATIYVNTAALLSEVKNLCTFHSSLMIILKSCYRNVLTYYPLLHENMIINLVRGIHYQMEAYSDMNSFMSCFYKMKKLEEEKSSPCVMSQSNEGEELVNAVKDLLHLLAEVTNCLVFPMKEEKKVPTNKLIIVLGYLHKMNKNYFPFIDNNMLKGCILKLLHEIAKQIKKEETNVSNYQILILINVELTHRGGYLNIPLLRECLRRLEEGSSNLFESEAEIILFLNFLKKFREAKKICGDYIESEDPSQHDDTFLLFNDAASRSSLDQVDRMVTQLTDKVTRVMFCPRVPNMVNLVNMANSPTYFKQTLLKPPHQHMYYPLRVYFLAYENISPNYSNEELIKNALLNKLTELMQFQKANLTEEDFFSIISSLLKHKIVDHKAYLQYDSFLREREGLVQMKYIFLVLKRILEEIPEGNLLRASEQTSVSQVNVDSPLISIIKISSDLILHDNQYRENFTFFKEILHVYLDKYQYFGEIAPQFNLFLLTHLNNLVRTMEQLSEVELARLVYHVASFYYTINKFSRDVFGVCGTKSNSRCHKIVANEWEGKKEQVKIGEDSIDSLHEQLPKPPHNDAKTDDPLHLNIQGGIALHSGKGTIVSYNEQDISKKLLQMLNCLLDVLYTKKLKCLERNEHMRLSLSNIIQVFVSLKNAKLRHRDLMRLLSERCVYIMFFQPGTIKLELQIRFFNSVVFLDYLNAVDEEFMRLASCHPHAAHNASMQRRHILYAHFHQLPRQAIYTPNISTYLLNFVSILDYLPFEHQRRGIRKAAFWICELLQMSFPKEVAPSTNMSTQTSMDHEPYSPPLTNLDKRNVFFLLSLLHLGKYPHINISAFPLKFLQQFYSHFILSEFAHLSVSSRVRSSSTHQSIYKFLETYLRKEFPRCDIYNEEEVSLFKVDLVILPRRHSHVSICVC
ncbi:conserved Plasmodium protein, unknown function [Plasmodium knowlesi strain H]|uniref:Uncharacterized protein n=3 Tax=Plasmodium knowlesi TaxID=5850 RepID=A0A5K1VPQ3_PLAKH|nr:conserved Plasmodium protein, unknown function [Plasmodium knowlesi strain H]OTN66629.1 Uncharacterized protein PKNOH_S08496300 [Plasmodium knowlesi]CAA9986768.1 conserved Plasmodium protein, unknown function [Plasmodium knowlesi strain H]SBO23599.1 conserved Plasmodium protein, unknown function [Plasmodium knowlesi strain H]SBO25154.1 conserved Plasmodium protein, unknown function [Plasmodium knowlesi strain H]VVS76242.1 conserved Plasmodium protein, unknown function [Plasmodium knowlesi s|eukprot:XP_002257952.1 hypothetical protein, conserved in Plasmodium species [Plasmodium knowlesi strain H]